MPQFKQRKLTSFISQAVQQDAPENATDQSDPEAGSSEPRNTPTSNICPDCNFV